MEQQYTLYKGDNGVWVMLTAGSQPVVAGTIQDVTAHLSRAHLLKATLPPASSVFVVNEQKLSGAAG